MGDLKEFIHSIWDKISIKIILLVIGACCLYKGWYLKESAFGISDGDLEVVGFALLAIFVLMILTEWGRIIFEKIKNYNLDRINKKKIKKSLCYLNIPEKIIIALALEQNATSIMISENLFDAGKSLLRKGFASRLEGDIRFSCFTFRQDAWDIILEAYKTDDNLFAISNEEVDRLKAR